MALVVRKVESRDRQALVSIIARTASLTAEERECAVELLDIYLNDRGQEDYLFAAAEDHGAPIGYVCYGPRSLAQGVFDLYWIIVDGDKKGTGVGRALVEAAVEALRGMGARMLVAETSGTGAYEAARGFYARCGFAEEARIKDFYRPGDDIVFYVKRLL